MPINQEKIDFIKKTETTFLDNAVRYNRENHVIDCELIQKISKMACEEIPVDEDLFLKLQNYGLFRTSKNFITQILYRFPKTQDESNEAEMWNEKDPLVQGMLKAQLNDMTGRFYMGWQYINSRIVNGRCDDFIKYLLTIGYKEREIIGRVLVSNRAVLYKYDSPLYSTELQQKGVGAKKELTSFGEYLVNKLPDDSLMNLLHELPLSHNRLTSTENILRFLIHHSKDTIRNDFDRYLYQKNYQNLREFNSSSLITLIHLVVDEQEKLILETIEKNAITAGQKFRFYYILNQFAKGKFHDQVTALGEKGFDFFIQTTPSKYYNSRDGHDPITYSRYLLSRDIEDGKSKIMNFIEHAQMLNNRYVQFLSNTFKEDAVPYLLAAMEKQPKFTDYNIQDYHKKLFDLLKPFDVSSHLDQIIDFAVNKSTKKTKKEAADFLIKYVDKITPQALELTKGKKIDQRIVGAMILAHSEDKKIKNYLLEFLDKEKNDDTRDILLESLHDLKFTQPYTYEEVIEMIEKADKRKKLSRWGEKWIEEEELPKLYWKENGQALTSTQVRFLFYRSKRAKGLNSDIEAKQMYAQLDKTKTANFANALLKAFQDSNAANKFKYYMTVAGLIGGDAALPKLNTLFRSCITNKRWRLAEYLVGAIAMVGSNKALRIVEMLSRKYASKRPKIGVAAREALNAVAIEFNITADQLADRIIPDFGFEDLYKTFEVGDDTYRAFVSKDNKLHYFNQDNKLRKSIPKETPKEIVAELKAIDKEIRVVVKAQAGRLEQYLVTERSWTVDEWNQYYRNSPIMLIYVQKLLWGLFKDDKLVDAFYCDEDIELYNFSDEEVELENGDAIKILHPLHLTAIELEQWKKKMYDMDFDFEFPILDRVVTEVLEEEKDSSFTKVFLNTDIPKGADYVVSFLSRKGWHKETADGGTLNFYKVCHNPKIQVRPSIEGPTAWYQGGQTKATLHEIYFTGENWQDKIKLKDVPKIFYSEVIADLKALINAE